jgi:small subunit ribosomal protein S17
MQERKVKTVEAVVVGKSGSKSIKVAMDYIFRHPKYGKTLRRQTRLMVHDERNEAGVGDVVEVAQCRPLSKTKSWRLVKILTKGADQQTLQQPESKI